MSFPRYEKYKDSGVEWLGEVPEHWEVKPLKYNASLQTEKAETKHNQVGLESVKSWTGQYIQTETKFEGAGVAFECDDILFGKLRPYLAKVFLPEFAGEAVGDFHVLRPVLDIDPKFLQYTMLNRVFIEIVDGSTFGAKMPRASWDFVGAMPTPTPSKTEQSTIAAFLDHETAKIDALVDEQRRLIELLKEKRQAVISHAVTKGLNPDAPMKDSGVEWLGEVPEHWEVVPFRALANIVRGSSPRPAGDPKYFNGESLPWVTVSEITKDRNTVLESTATCLTEEGVTQSRIFQAGTLIYSNSGATLGVPKILAIKACANDGVVGFFDLSSRLRPGFAYHYLSTITGEIREWLKQGSGQPNLNTDLVKALRIAIPDIKEQDLLLNHITQSISDFSNLESEATKLIDYLKERRTALISAAVTGKIDVRNHAPTSEGVLA
tara:strand:- start:21415 stop:22722 length:1308 start_codon:yes stop_codon:yes gene_type:complete